MSRIFSFFISILIFTGCQETYTPKPYGYFRIDFPEKSWMSNGDSLPYQFEVAQKAFFVPDLNQESEKGWTNIHYPQYNANIHISYKKITTDTSLTDYISDSHHLVYRHTIKAESINEKYFRINNTFGVLYFIEGNTASSTQFFVTDSTRHFLRGALYFNQHPDKDSLAPIIQYLREDIIHLMETIRFNNNQK